MVQWISQGGMLNFLVLFLSFFFCYGLMSFFESPEISQEISKNFPELSEDFKYFAKEGVKQFIINNETVMALTRILFIFFIFILGSITSASAYSLLLSNPIQKTAQRFGYIFNCNLICISMLVDINLNRLYFYGLRTTFLSFGLNLMLWTFTHFVLHYKAKSAKKTLNKFLNSLYTCILLQ